MEQEFKLVAKTFMGLEPVLAQELTRLGAKNVETGRRMVSFTGDKEMMYKANFQLHTAIRILKPIAEFKATNPDEVYDEIYKIDWSSYLDLKKSFAVDSVVFSEDFKHSKFVAYKVKDAIVDQFREKFGQRPNISVSNPDIRLNIHIAEDNCTLSLDSSGESLHRRGYRQESVEAPLNEVLAAGMIMLTGWHGECDFIDPMCGSGTLLIEAALIARNMAPGLFRKEFAFEKWNDFDKDLFDKIYNDDSQEVEFEHHIYGYDIDMKAVNTALANVKAAGVMKDISVANQDFKKFEQPAEKAIIVTNPPYGERISTPNLLGTYRMIGDRLKHQFMGNDAWVLSYRVECFDEIGLKPSIKFPLYNGSLECEFRKYQMFDGKFKEFRKDGNVLKTDKEKKYMAEKHFKKNREFNQRTEDIENNEEGDIRTFKFARHSFTDDFEGGRDRGARRGGGRRYDDDDDFRGSRDRGDRRGGSDRRSSGKRFDNNEGYRGNRDDRNDRGDRRGGRDNRGSRDNRGGYEGRGSYEGRGGRDNRGDRDSRGGRDSRGSKGGRRFDNEE